MSQLSQEQQKVIEQVQKLLALSKSSNENEAALALAKAESLLEKYRLDMTQIEMMTGQKEEIIEDKDPVFDSEKIVLWESNLAIRVAFLYGCSTIRLRSPDDDLDKVIRLIGRPSDIMFVRYLLNYITIELCRLSIEPLYKKRKDYKDSWFLGAVDVITMRLRQAQEETQKQFENPFAVVTVNNRFNESQVKLNEIYKEAKMIDIEKEKESTKIRQEAYSLGREAGHKVKLSNNGKLSAKSTLN